LAYELAATWRWPNFTQRNQSELSHMAGAVNYSTINIVVVIIYFFRPLAQSRRLKIVLSKVWLQRPVIGVKSVQEGDCVYPLEGYLQPLKQKGGFSGSPVIIVIVIVIIIIYTRTYAILSVVIVSLPVN